MRRLLNTLYVTNPDAMVRKRHDAICVTVPGQKEMSVPFHILDGVVLFGHVGASSAFIASCAERGLSVVLLDEQGRFRARVEGAVSGSVLLRREQYRRALSEDESLLLARRFVMAKVHNARIVLLHSARDHQEHAAELRQAAETLQMSKASALHAATLDELRGIEGDAAHTYFGNFHLLLRSLGNGVQFKGRSRRPPQDPVNACLSLFYTLLARDVATACESVGLDPQMGYLHACRPGRASLALDLMEEFRAPYVDRFVLSLFNRGQLQMRDFNTDVAGGVFFRDNAMKDALRLWQEKKQEKVTHPFLGERIPYGLLPFLQAQLLARHLRGDLDGYPACLWR